MVVPGALAGLFVLIETLIDDFHSNFLKDKKMRQQSNDSAGVVHPPKELPARPRSPIFKRQPIPCAPAKDISSTASYLNKWQVGRSPPPPFVFNGDIYLM
jgi:hypothetical protein